MASLRPERGAFLAGTPDRTVERRCFNLLAKPLRKSHFVDFGDYVDTERPDTYVAVDSALDKKYTGELHPSKVVVVDAQGFRHAYSSGMRDLLTKPLGTRQDVGLRMERRSILGAAFDAGHVALNDLLRARISNAMMKRPEPKRASSFPSVPMATARFLGLKTLPTGVIGIFSSADSPAYLVIAKNFFDNVLDALDAAGAAEALTGDVGVLFSDRLRFRPAGLVVGEPLYTLALAPGEEVQVRQTVETKLHAVLEQIDDREQESNLTRSSTWSTDISEALTDTSNFQSGMQLTEGLTASPGAASEVPIGGNMGLSTSVSEAYTSTEQRTVRTNRQLTAQATAKMRQQHKTRMEITTEQSTGLVTTRTVRNANLQRPVTFIFSKVYRREQALLERYGARLCLRWVIDDPARTLRQRFLDHLNRLDPDVKANYVDVAAPDVLETVEEVTLKMYSYYDGMQAVGDMSSEYTPYPLASRFDVYGQEDRSVSRATSRPDVPSVTSDYYLVGKPKVTFLRMHLRDEGPTRGQERSRDTGSGDDWNQISGDLIFKVDPTAQPGDEKGTLHVGAHAEYNHIPPRDFDWRNPNAEAAAEHLDTRLFLYGPTEVTVTITATWAKDDTTSLAEQEPVAQRRNTLQQGLTVEALTMLRDTLARDYAGQVLATAFRSAIGGVDGDYATMVPQMFDYQDVVVESIPYWASAAGRDAQTALQERLQHLNIALPIGDFMIDEFTASKAIVYVPIREGHEADALAAATTVDSGFAQSLVRQIDAMRAQHFGSTLHPVPTFDDVTGPGLPVATPSDASAWATDWEKPAFRFDLLAAWSELVPTDGVHLDAVLRESVAADEHRTLTLGRASI